MESAASQEFSIARASFMLTHRVSGSDFDFMTMMHEALELDFSRVLENAEHPCSPIAATGLPPGMDCKPGMLFRLVPSRIMRRLLL